MSVSNSLPPETEQLLGAANFESMAQRLSVRFSQILREWLSESEMAEVVARNAAETNPQICHSHDLADPNQAMLDAAKDLGFREIDVLDGPLSSAGIDLWNAAWNLAKSNGFEPDHVHCSDQGKGHHSDGRFNVLEQTLDDKSKVFDVYFCSPNGQELICNAPTEQTATELNSALNAIRDRFLDCGSDREVVNLACSFDAWLRQSKAAYEGKFH